MHLDLDFHYLTDNKHSIHLDKYSQGTLRNLSHILRIVADHQHLPSYK